MTRLPWVVMLTRPLRLACLRCGQIEPLAEASRGPQAVAFRQRHDRCRRLPRSPHEDRPGTHQIDTPEFGTRRPATVRTFERVGDRGSVLVCHADDNPREGIIVVGGRHLGPAPVAGQRGIIEFVAGGPFGGYWRFEADDGDVPQGRTGDG